MKVTMSGRGETVLIALMSIFLIGWFQYSNTLPDPDSFYHAKIAQLLSQGILLQTMPWMGFSTLTHSFTDHHFLYHVALIPLVKIMDPLGALKLATAVISSGLLVLLYRLMKAHGSFPKFFWLLLIASSSFIFRINLVKANALSLLILFLIIHYVLKRDIFKVGVLQALYVWSYGGWVLGVGVTGLYWLGSLIQKKVWRPAEVIRTKLSWVLLANIVGAVLGVIMHPNWPQNLSFYWQQVVQIGLINYSSIINVGSEWYPLTWQAYISAHALAFGALVIVLYFSLSRIRHWQAEEWTTLVLAILFSALAFKSRRYLELSIPFVIFTASVYAKKWIPAVSFPSLWRAMWQRKVLRYYTLIMITGLLPILLAFSLGGIVQSRRSLISAFNFSYYESESSWLRENTPPGSIIFHNDWDDWPMLFYFNDANRYIVGLDPTFMFLKDDYMYDTYARVTLGEIDNPSQVIHDMFRSMYVLVDHEHKRFREVMDDDPYADQVFEGAHSVIYLLSVPSAEL